MSYVTGVFKNEYTLWFHGQVNKPAAEKVLNEARKTSDVDAERIMQSRFASGGCLTRTVVARAVAKHERKLRRLQLDGELRDGAAQSPKTFYAGLARVTTLLRELAFYVGVVLFVWTLVQCGDHCHNVYHYAANHSGMAAAAECSDVDDGCFKRSSNTSVCCCRGADCEPRDEGQSGGGVYHWASFSSALLLLASIALGLFACWPRTVVKRLSLKTEVARWNASIKAAPVDFLDKDNQVESVSTE